jgi:hypothetical protein
MPIKNRIDMLTTGIRTPVGIKVFGADLKQIEALGNARDASSSGARHPQRLGERVPAVTSSTSI